MDSHELLQHLYKSVQMFSRIKQVNTTLGLIRSMVNVVQDWLRTTVIMSCEIVACTQLEWEHGLVVSTASLLKLKMQPELLHFCEPCLFCQTNFAFSRSLYVTHSFMFRIQSLFLSECMHVPVSCNSLQGWSCKFVFIQLVYDVQLTIRLVVT